MEIAVFGSAYSPVNSYWGSLGNIEVQFDLQGGHSTSLLGQTVDAQVTNFKLLMNGHPYAQLDSALATYYLSPNQSGIAIQGSNDLFVWNFNGPKWDGGSGGWRSESNEFDLSFSHATVSTPEPSPLALLGLAMVVFGIKMVKRATAT